MFYIEEIKFNNFRQYRSPEKTTVNFVYNESTKKNVNIVEGTNGYGKTNFLSGLLWCFYGDENKSPGERFILLNRLTGDELKEGESSEVSVEICINYGGDRYSVRRSQNFKKSNGEIVPTITGSSKAGTKFEIFALEQSNSHLEESPESFINVLMPQEMREYFFFDGEKLEKYFDSKGQRKIRDSVFQVSQLSVVNTIIENSRKLEVKLKKDVNKMPGASADIEQELNITNGKIDQLERDVAELNESKIKLDDKLKAVIEQYEIAGGDTANKLIKERKEVEEKILNLRQTIKEKTQELQHELGLKSPLIIGADLILKSRNLFKKAEQEKLIPPNIRPEFINSLIDSASCICGTHLKGSEEADQKMERLKQMRASIPSISSHAQSAMHIWAGMDEMLSGIAILKSDSQKMYLEREQLSHDLKALKDRKEKIDLEVSNEAELVGIGNIKKTITDITDQVHITSKQIGAKSEELVKLKEVQSELERKQQKLTASSSDAAIIQRRIDSIQNLIMIAQGIQNKIMEETRHEISEHTKKFFAEMMHGLGNVSEIDIEINQEYELTCEVEGRDIIATFAAGQKSALAVSFLMALNKFTGFHTPIIFDSVLGRIGDNMRSNFAKTVPHVLSSKQLIFLFLDSEFDVNVREEISETLGSLYKIKRKSSDEQFVTESELVKQN